MDISLKIELEGLVAKGRSQDDVLCYLKKRTALITDAIVAVRQLYQVNLGEAKRLVSGSRHWQEVQTNNENLHEAFEEIALQHNLALSKSGLQRGTTQPEQFCESPSGRIQKKNHHKG